MKRTALALLGAFLIAAPAAQAQQKIVFGTVTVFNISLAPLFLAESAGFFKEEGIEVEKVPFNGTATLLPQMTSKRVHVGYPNPDVLIVSRQPGKDPLPLKFFFNVTRESAWEFVVPEASPIKKLADLKGKKVGVGALTFGNIPITRAMFKEMGIEVGKDLELVPVGVGAPAFLAFREGKVDALNLFDAQHATLETSGTPIRRLDMPRKYVDLFSNGFIAHEDMLKENPRALAGFGRAFAKGVVACEANRPACVRNFWKMYPAQKPAGDEAKVLADQIKVMNSRFDKMLAFEGGKRRFGEYAEQGWRDFTEALLVGGQIQTKEIDIASLYTNALVPEINKFDAAAVAAKAKAAN
jgi:NitT/TauT family transport system substrate-binding protein